MFEKMKVQKVVEKTYDKGYLDGKIAAYQELSGMIEFLAQAAITALDAEIEELEKKQV